MHPPIIVFVVIYGLDWVATVAGVVRDGTGEYTLAWFGAAGLCAVAAVVSISIARHPRVDA